MQFQISKNRKINVYDGNNVISNNDKNTDHNNYTDDNPI